MLQLEPGTYSSCHVDGSYIAMTFDDGPCPAISTRLFDILKQRNSGDYATYVINHLLPIEVIVGDPANGSA
jgi:hypothetical protein